MEITVPNFRGEYYNTLGVATHFEAVLELQWKKAVIYSVRQ